MRMRCRVRTQVSHLSRSHSISLGLSGPKKPLSALVLKQSLIEICRGTLKILYSRLADVCHNRCCCGHRISTVTILSRSLLLFLALRSLLLSLLSIFLGHLSISSCLFPLNFICTSNACCSLIRVNNVFYNTHTLGFAVRHEVDGHLLASYSQLVDIVETASEELEVRALG